MNIARSVLAALAAGALTASAWAADGKVTIGVSLASDTNPFYIAVKDGIQKKAREMGVDAVFVTANEDAARQISGIQDLIARGVDALLVSPIDSAAVVPAYQMAGGANIPVVSLVRFVNSPYQKLEVTFDWKEIGHKVGVRIGDEIGRKGKVAVIAGPVGAQLFRDLAAGFKSAIAAYPDIKIVYDKDVALTREAGLKSAEDALSAHPDLAAIYGGNDEVALGAVQAVAAAGRAGKTVVAGLNGVPPAIKAVKDGSLLLTYDLNPTGWGAAAFDAAVAYARGKSVTLKDINLPSTLVDRSNVDHYLK
ncbi:MULTISPECIES: substrate-binding domain-containing protein [unclassified Beijerinckia]|uniref:sugar ABC transporter substrate-binding protein n=1 Tax=unclassified Beijerinckia TaxID=2638183 RepID=UPI0008980F27|nr:MULTISPECIES: substrate-binding domain-containing protein [unclassified Beijerinckia]MDH7796793.1 ribose transport system substrate-binding protein [Beijerinckia sp. GAS462]SEC60055.1 ribose transport system substrate-binding protein [Beijerinckia sp. 28-YEA-48]